MDPIVTCEGCLAPAVCEDCNGVPLCAACYDALDFDDDNMFEASGWGDQQDPGDEHREPAPDYSIGVDPGTGPSFAAYTYRVGNRLVTRRVRKP